MNSDQGVDGFFSPACLAVFAAFEVAASPLSDR